MQGWKETAMPINIYRFTFGGRRKVFDELGVDIKRFRHRKIHMLCTGLTCF